MTNIVAAIQMTSVEDVADNLAQAAKLIANAAAQEAQLVVLPEMFAIMSMQVKAKIAAAEEYGSGPIQDFLATQAQRHQLWLVSGTIPLLETETQKIHAACLVLNPQGEVVARYNKIHLFDAIVSEHEVYQESANISAGTTITVVDTPVGKLGLAVCYDIRFPELFRSMLNQGAEIFTVATAFTVPTGRAHWEILMRSRAIENLSYVIGACQVGEHGGGRRTYGHSLVVDPWGEILVSRSADVGIVTTAINLQRLHEIRKQMPALQHQQIFMTR